MVYSRIVAYSIIELSEKRSVCIDTEIVQGILLSKKNAIFRTNMQYDPIFI